MSNASTSSNTTGAGNGNINGNPAAHTNNNNNNGGAGNLTENIVIPRVPKDVDARQKWIFNVRTQAIQPYAQQSKKLGKVPPPSIQTDEWLRRIRELLNYLEWGDFQITPAYKGGTTMMSVFLKFLFQDKRFHFPEDISRRAQSLYEEYERVNWGAAAEEEEEEEDADEGEDQEGEGGSVGGGSSSTAVSPTSSSSSSTPDGQYVVRLPPPNHPIWGINGIMFGIAVKFGGKWPAMQLDRRYLRQKRDANVFGHNGLQPGAWFPNQLVALFRGAHGSRMGGIHGNKIDGAYSVVISGMYHKVDEDLGNRIYYSGPGSQENTDPDTLPKGSADVLHVSLERKRPIRVLRSSRNPFSLSPSVGIRYDGLYVVTRRMPLQKNEKGGVFARFVLERIENGGEHGTVQESLLSIAQRSPTAKEKRDFERIKQYF